MMRERTILTIIGVDEIDNKKCDPACGYCSLGGDGSKEDRWCLLFAYPLKERARCQDCLDATGEEGL